MSLQVFSQQAAARPGNIVSGSLSLSSYKEYPARHPFINTPRARVRLSKPPALPSKGLPESNSAGNFQSSASVLRCSMVTVCAT